MDLKHLRTFVAVADRGSVSKAALLLRITQPALSRQIRDLQEQLGLKLFQRVGSRLVLTGEGEQLLGRCRDLLNHAESLREQAQSLCSGNTGVLRIAAGSKIIERVFPTFLRHYAVLYPGVQMKLFEAKPGERLAMLERGEVHFAIGIVRTNDDRFARYTLRQHDVLAAYAPSLPIGRTDVIDVGQLAELPLLLLRTSSATRKIFDAACRLTHLQPNIFIESDAPSLLALAEAGHGVAIVASSERIDSKKLRIARLACRRALLQMVLGVVWDKRRLLPHYAEGFPNSFAAHMQEVFPLSRPSQPRQGRPEPRRLSVAAGAR
jgi:DNA-binding transcriptional LysR family regulator